MKIRLKKIEIIEHEDDFGTESVRKKKAKHEMLILEKDQWYD